MSLLNKYIDYLTANFQQRKAIAIFCKAVILLTIIKLALTWPVSHRIMHGHVLPNNDSLLKSIVMAPSMLAKNSIDLFYGISLSLLTIIFFARWSYVSALLFCWLIINVNRINFLISNGGDSVLLLLSCLMLGMACVPAVKQEKLKVIQYAVFNFSVLITQIQIVLIYFISGWDKVSSDIWRSGEAFAYLPHLDFMFNPLFADFLTDDLTDVTLSWITIAFELSFVGLVWFKRTRLIILAIGVLFHLVIGIALSLPDFACIMIISYLIFLKDSDYEYLRSRFTRLPP